MVIIVMGMVDLLGGLILFFNGAGTFVAYLGIGMILKGIYSIISDIAFFFHG
ncbi:MAG TPA: hypothetical protein VJH34_01875 [archaeon]|nr:hypothetical protein [archaeon]